MRIRCHLCFSVNWQRHFRKPIFTGPFISSFGWYKWETIFDNLRRCLFSKDIEISIASVKKKSLKSLFGLKFQSQFSLEETYEEWPWVPKEEITEVEESLRSLVDIKQVGSLWWVELSFVSVNSDQQMQLPVGDKQKKTKHKNYYKNTI